jgi:hypothetical protein
MGVRNFKALKKLKDKMMEMYNRRKERFWDNVIVNKQDEENEKDDNSNYRMKNIISLRIIAKERGIYFLHKSKDEIIESLEAYDKKVNYESIEQVESKNDYDNMTSRQLKYLAKERGFRVYNNLNNTTLRQHHKHYDDAMQKKQEDKHADIENDEEYDLDTNETVEFSLTLHDGENHPILIRKDGIVNATMLCKAGGKHFAHYQRNEKAQAFIEAVKNDMHNCTTELINIKQGGDPKNK